MADRIVVLHDGVRRADRRAARPLRPARQPVRRRVHRLARDELLARAFGGGRRPLFRVALGRQNPVAKRAALGGGARDHSRHSAGGISNWAGRALRRLGFPSSNRPAPKRSSTRRWAARRSSASSESACRIVRARYCRSPSPEDRCTSSTPRAVWRFPNDPPTSFGGLVRARRGDAAFTGGKRGD